MEPHNVLCSIVVPVTDIHSLDMVKSLCEADLLIWNHATEKKKKGNFLVTIESANRSIDNKQNDFYTDWTELTFSQDGDYHCQNSVCIKNFRFLWEFKFFTLTGSRLKTYHIAVWTFTNWIKCFNSCIVKCIKM